MLKLFTISLIGIFLLSFIFSISEVFALDCTYCAVGTCYCNVTECPSGTMDIYTTQCSGFPVKEFIFANSNFTWMGSQSLNYYFKVLCDNGNTANCTNVNLTSFSIPTTTTTTTTSATTTSSVPLQTNCPYDCCIGDPSYYNRYCAEGEQCINNQCIATTTTAAPSGPAINYSLIGIVAIVIIVAVFVFFFIKNRKPSDRWETLYKKYGRR